MRMRWLVMMERCPPGARILSDKEPPFLLFFAHIIEAVKVSEQELQPCQQLRVRSCGWMSRIC